MLDGDVLVAALEGGAEGELEGLLKLACDHGVRRCRTNAGNEPVHFGGPRPMMQRSRQFGGGFMRPKSAIMVLFILSLGVAASVSSATKKAAAKPTDAQLIASAMKAAPMSVAKSASIVTMEADGSMRTLRKGTNGFTCMPDNPATPGPDPMCFDANAMEWAKAWMSHQPPPTGRVGFMYMLAGGTDASNTDPWATKPTASNHWVKTGPHIMVVGGDQAFYDSYPKSADPDTSVPYVMWAGTPYQHLMAPVK
jgi:hypothetical protein